MPSSINERIKHYRNEKGYTQCELAAKLGIKTSTYSQMEREGNVSADMVLNIAEALAIDPTLIFLKKTESEIEITPIKPQILIAKSPDVTTTLYGDTPQPEMSKVEYKPSNDLPFTLTNTEKDIIKIYHNLPKAQQKEIREFIQSIRERGR